MCQDKLTQIGLLLFGQATAEFIRTGLVVGIILGLVALILYLAIRNGFWRAFFGAGIVLAVILCYRGLIMLTVDKDDFWQSLATVVVGLGYSLAFALAYIHVSQLGGSAKVLDPKIISSANRRTNEVSDEEREKKKEA